MRAAPLLIAALSLLLSAPSFAAEGLSGRLLTRGPATAGAEIEVQVEISWSGRPELVAPGVPDITVPEGAGVRLGRTGSSFNGTSSRWWTNSTVTLPDQSTGPWSIGPATVTVALQGGGTDVVTTAPKVLGRTPRRGLVGQALASGVVLALAIGAFLWMFRRLRPEDSGLSELARRLQAAVVAGDVDAMIDHGIALHQHLEGHRVARDYLPDVAGLTKLRELSRFGGQAATAEGLRPLVMPLLTITGTLLDPEAPR
jgi:hypothetical protein